MQRYTIYLSVETALHVSGVISNNHQEHIQVYLQHQIQVPDAVDTLVGAPDGGWRYHQKHVEQFPQIVTLYRVGYTGLFISPSGISELDCATTKRDTAERSISIGRESLQVFFVLGALVYFQVPPLGGIVKKNGVHSE